MRRTLIITGIVLAILGIGVAIYFIFFTNKANVSVAPTDSAGLPLAGNTVPVGEENAAASVPDVSAATPVSARLVKISAGPVVPGEAVVNIPAKDASSTPDIAVKYIERQSGNVFTYLTRAKTITRTSNKTVPGIQSAAWLPNGSLAFVRYLSGANFSTVNTYALSADSSDDSDGFFLPQNTTDIAVSSTSVLSLVSGANGSIASLSRTDGARTSEIFTTPLSAIRASFAGKNQYLVYTKPSSMLDGNAFLVDGSGRFSRIAGPLFGLSALSSNSGKWVLVSYTLDNDMQMKLVNTLTGESLSLPVATIADKCVWTNNDSSIYCGISINPPTTANYPDDWYQGAIRFSDRIWRIDVSNRYAQLILDFKKETDTELDAYAFAVDPLASTLTFVNKNDGALWVYSL